jgi:hypothetical protein
VPDWLSPLNAWVSIPLQALGFGLTFWQIRKTRKSADAAKTAALGAQAQIGSNLLLVVLPQLNQIETNLEWAISNSNRIAVVHYLGSWRWQAGQVRGHLERQGEEDEEFLTMLQSSIATAADTKLAIQDPSTDLTKRTRAALKSIAAVTGLVGEMTARNSIEKGSQPIAS